MDDQGPPAAGRNGGSGEGSLIRERRGQALKTLANPLLCLIVGLLPVGVRAEPLLAGWSITQQENDSTMYRHGEDGVIVVGPLPAGTPTGFPNPIAAQFDQPGVCPGLNASTPTAKFQGLAQQVQYNGAVICTIIIGSGSDGSFVIAAIEQRGSNVGAAAFAQRIAMDKIGAAGENVASTNAQPVRVQSISTSGKAGLLQAIAAVPAAHRPIGYVLRSETAYDGSNLQFVFKPWMLFANGYATNCYEWDPAIIAPTPAAFASAGLDCTLERWRRAGNDAQFQSDDGAWSEGQTLSDFKPVRAGTRLNLRLEALSTFSTLSNWGSPGLAIFDVSRLQMSENGRLIIGDTKYSWRNSDSETTSSAGLSGEYYLDGFLMSVRGPNGEISRHFFTALLPTQTDEKQFVFIDGTQFSPP
jgi:hypothetical protein